MPNSSSQNSRYYTYIKPVLQNKYVKNYSSYVFSLLTTGVLILFAIRPTISTIVDLQKQIEDNQKLYDQLKTKGINLSQGQKNYLDLDANTKLKIRQTVPLTPDVTSLLKSIEAAAPPQASAAAIQIQPITLYQTGAVVTGHPKLGEIDFNYTLTGTYDQLMTTINNFSKLPRLISISSMSITKQPTGPITLTVIGKGYYLR